MQPFRSYAFQRMLVLPVALVAVLVPFSSATASGAGSGTISGATWKDLNRDGVQQADEPVLTDQQLYLLDGAGNYLATTYSDASGRYEFSGLADGDYTAKFALSSWAALRGDWGAIILEDGCNVQENCTIHMFPGVTVLLKAGAHIGHGAIIHGATIGRNCLVGMNAVIMDNVVLGDECIIGALTFIKEGEQIPSRSLLVGNPAKIIKQVTDEMIAWKTKGTQLYQSLPAEMQADWKVCEPLREIPASRPEQEVLYESWKKLSNS